MICIYGASYGCYAAMWGLVNPPILYRSGVSVSGVGDIAYMFADSSDTNNDQTALEIMRQTVGAISKDQSMFDAVSPLKHADRISAPLLLMHGEHELRVPIAHSEKKKNALDKHKKYCEWLEFKYEGHSIQILENRKKYLTKLTEFLAKYLK